MSDIEQALEGLKMEKIEEKSIEVKEVIVKLNFTFEDGEIQDPLQSAIYDMLVDNNAIIDETETEDANTQLSEFQE